MHLGSRTQALSVRKQFDEYFQLQQGFQVHRPYKRHKDNNVTFVSFSRFLNETNREQSIQFNAFLISGCLFFRFTL